MKVPDKLKVIIKNQNFRHGILYTLFSFFNSGLSFILLLILARYLSPYDYGLLNLFTTFVTLANIVITLCTVSYVGVCFFRKNAETLRQVIVIALGTTTVMLLILSGILLVIPTQIEKLIGIPQKFLWCGLLICYFQVFNSLNLDIWRLEEKPIRYGIYSISFAVCNFILTFWLVVGMNLGWEGRVYAWWILGVLYFIISCVFLVKRKYLNFSIPQLSLVSETLIYALPIIPHSVSFWLRQGLDRYIINFYYDQTNVGYFSIAMNLASIIGIVGTAFNSTNSVSIYKRLSEGVFSVKDSLRRQIRLMNWVFFIITIIVCIGAYGLIYLALPKYLDSIRYLIPLCIGGLFQCLYLLWVNFLFYYKQTKKLMHITISTAILQALLSLWLTRYDILYTAYISMGISLITMLLVRAESKRCIQDITK